MPVPIPKFAPKTDISPAPSNSILSASSAIPMEVSSPITILPVIVPPAFGRAAFAVVVVLVNTPSLVAISIPSIVELVVTAPLKAVAPKLFDAAVEVIPFAAVIPPPSAIVIASSPSVYSIKGVLIEVAKELDPVAVIAPDPIVPIVAIFFEPSKTTAFDAAAVPAVIPSIISNSASAITALPIVKPVAVTTPAPNVPEVDKFSFPKSIAPLLSVIEPLAKVKLPMVEPVAADIVLVKVEASSAVKAPTLKGT